MNDRHCDVAIIGAGIVGLSVGLQLGRKYPGLKIVILEKESEVASHQSGHNSGVIHSGLYYKPGSLKARLCVEGREAMIQFCREHNIPHDICGKIIVATEEIEIPRLNELLRRGLANRVSGLRELDAGQIRDLEPYASGIRGIHVPTTGITDFKMVSAKYAELIRQGGGEILTNSGVNHIARETGAIVLETPSTTVHARFVVNCAGLQSDLIARMAGATLGLRIVPFRGEYYELVPAMNHLIKCLVYPVVDPRFPFLGVHFTRRIHGGVEAGPNAVLSFKREGYTRTSFDFSELLSTALFPGFGKWPITTGIADWAKSIAPGTKRLSRAHCKGWCPVSTSRTFNLAALGFARRRWIITEIYWTTSILCIRIGYSTSATCRLLQQQLRS